MLTFAAGLAGCAPTQAHQPDAAASTITRLGAVPIPPAPGPPHPAPASPGNPQLLTTGALIEATLPEGTAQVTALGPQLDNPPNTATPHEHTTATITIRATQITGHLRLRARDFTARDDHAHTIALTTTTPNTTTDPTSTTLRLTGDFHTGSAQITWRHNTSVIALWTFTIELD